MLEDNSTLHLVDNKKKGRIETLKICPIPFRRLNGILLYLSMFDGERFRENRTNCRIIRIFASIFLFSFCSSLFFEGHQHISIAEEYNITIFQKNDVENIQYSNGGFISLGSPILAFYEANCLSSL